MRTYRDSLRFETLEVEGLSTLSIEEVAETADDERLQAALPLGRQWDDRLVRTQASNVVERFLVRLEECFAAKACSVSERRDHDTLQRGIADPAPRRHRQHVLNTHCYGVTRVTSRDEGRSVTSPRWDPCPCGASPGSGCVGRQHAEDAHLIKRVGFRWTLVDLTLGRTDLASAEHVENM